MRTWGSELIEKLDEDGPEPDDRPPAPVNELHLLPHRGRPGGSVKGRFDDPALYDAIATLIDAKAAPRTGDDERSAAQRQAEAFAEVCGYVLDHGDVPETGGRRPHLNVIISLEELEGRARAAMLDFGGRLSPEALRLLACDAAVVPIVMNGAGQPLDVGRAKRTIPDGLRRAVAARDRGCARCGKPPVLVRNAPHHRMGERRGNQAEQLRHALQNVPPPDPFHRLDGSPPRRPPGVHPAGLDRPGSTSPPKTPAPPHPRLMRAARRGGADAPMLARFQSDVVHPLAIERYQTTRRRQQHESARSCCCRLLPHDGTDDEEWRAGVGGDFTRPVIVGHDLQRIEMSRLPPTRAAMRHLICPAHSRGRSATAGEIPTTSIEVGTAAVSGWPGP